MTRFAMLLVSVVLLASALPAPAAETLESVEQKIARQAAGWKTLQYIVRATMSAADGQTSVNTVTEGHFQFVRKPDRKMLYRQEGKTRRVIKTPGQPDQVEEGTFLVIFDGTHVYQLTQVEDQKTATRTAAARQPDAFDVAEADLDRLRKDYNLKLLPDAAIDSRKAYVIEAVPKKKPGPGDPGRIVNYYDKQTGLPLKSVIYDAAGKDMISTSIADSRVNADIPAERFVFRPPPGVELLDMTRLVDTTQPGDIVDETVPPERPDE